MKTFAIFILLFLVFIVPLAMLTFGALILCMYDTTVGQVFTGVLLMIFGMLLLIASIILTAIGISD